MQGQISWGAQGDLNLLIRKCSMQNNSHVFYFAENLNQNFKPQAKTTL